MQNLIQILAYSAGSIFLGIALTIYLFVTLSRRRRCLEGGEGCFANFVVLMVLGVAVFCFVVAVQVAV